MVGILLLIFTIARTDSFAQSQIFPDSIFAGSSSGQLQEMVLKAIQENGRMNSLPGSSVGFTNVVSLSANSELSIFTTDNTLSVVEAKVRAAYWDPYIRLVKQSQNSFSLTGLPSGVYTIDIINQKGNAIAAYEGILVLGQEPTNPHTRMLIERQIRANNGQDRIEALIPPPDPCLVSPNQQECQDPCIENPDAEGCQESLPLPTDACEQTARPECPEDIGDDFSDTEIVAENNEDTGGGDEGGGDEGGGDEGGGDEGGGDEGGGDEGGGDEGGGDEGGGDEGGGDEGGGDEGGGDN
jgi:uncharacterized membrane protein YgcG